MKRYKFKSNIEASTQKAQISSKGVLVPFSLNEQTQKELYYAPMEAIIKIHRTNNNIKGLETEQDNIIDCDIKYKQQEIKTLENKELNKQRKLESSYFYNLTNNKNK